MTAETIPLTKTGWSIAKKHLPNFILRMLVNRDKVSRQLEVRLGPGYAIELQRSSIPALAIQVILTNHSPIRITVDRIHVQFWLGQPIFTKDHTRRIVVSPYTTNHEFLSFDLADNQLSRIADSLDESRRVKLGYPVSLRLDLECDTGIGSIKKTENINYNGEISR